MVVIKPLFFEYLGRSRQPGTHPTKDIVAGKWGTPDDAAKAAVCLVPDVTAKRFWLTRKKVLYALLSGILVFLIVNFLMLAIQYGEASIVIPVANLSFVIALLLSIALKIEALTIKKLSAVGCAAVSIILLSRA